MRSIVAAAALAALSGCAVLQKASDVCEEHQTVCSVGAAVVVSSVVTTVAMHQAKHQLSQQMQQALMGAGGPQTAVIRIGGPDNMPVAPPPGGSR